MTSKNRNMLQNFAKEREEFERQKKELEAQMNKGKQNLGHIRKGMRTHEISHLKDVETDGDSIQHVKSHDRHDKSDSAATPKRRPTIHGMGKSQTSLHAHAVSAHPSSHPSQHAKQDLCKSPSFGNIYVPPCRRASDWFFTSDDISSRPPGMKHQDVYNNVRFLGRGAFGSVDLVKHNDDNRLYAQKTILLENSDVDEDQLFQEVRSLRVNRHPFIISVADVYCLVNPRRLFIVLHYCEGGDLAKMISTNHKTQSLFPESQVIRWMAQIALALQYLQEHHYLHRDIKPANMLMCDNGDIVKLGDFGFAVQIDENNLKSLSTAEVGTPFYTAPEMIKQEPCSFPSDNWSFGIMLYEILLLGRHPFDGATTAELVRGIINEEPPPLPDMYSKEFVQVAQALLKKDPAERMTMPQFLTSAPIQHKVAAIPNNYKPKHHMEERFRRTQVRQLTHQLDSLGITAKSSHASHSHAHHHSSSHLHSTEAPAPQLSMSRKGAMSERGMKGGEAATTDNFEETKRRLSMKYGPIEAMSTDSAEPTVATEAGSLPSISVRTSSAEGSRKETNTSSSPPSAESGGAVTHLPQLGKISPPTASPNKGVSPSMQTHKEENNADIDGERDNRLPDTSPRGVIASRVADSGKLPSEKSTSSLLQSPVVDSMLVEETSAALAAEEREDNDLNTEGIVDGSPQAVAVEVTEIAEAPTVSGEQSGGVTTTDTVTPTTVAPGVLEGAEAVAQAPPVEAPAAPDQTEAPAAEFVEAVTAPPEANIADVPSL